METIKSGAVIIVMLGVLYGVFVALNKPETRPPEGYTQQKLDELAPPRIDIASLPPAASDVVAAPPGFGPTSTLAPTSSIPPSSTVPPSSAPASPANLESAPRTARSYGAASSVYTTPSKPEVSPAITLPSPSATSATGDYQRSTYETPVPPSESSSAYSSSSSAELPTTTPPEISSSPALTAYSFKRAWQAAEAEIAAGKFRAALAGLSPYYQHPDLSADERAQLTAWLDALAAKVIYSTEHLLAEPYVVRSGQQTLFDVAGEFHVPADLLQNINQQAVSDPQVLVPGTVLKVVPGPFRAEANLSTGELTLYLGELYAGRFPFTVGNEPPATGEHQVADKRTDRAYYGVDRTITANDPANPYGGYWLDLGRETCIHGSSLAGGGQPLGCISLSPQDARDVYHILSRGSTVVVKR